MLIEPIVSQLRVTLLSGAVLDAYGCTDPGRVCERNDDSFLLLAEEPLFAVADGVGGAPAGDVASAEVMACFRKVFTRYRTATSSASSQEERAVELLQLAVERAHLEIRQLATRDPSLRGMGSTVVVIAALGHCFVIGHVGDSRAYRLRSGTFELLTDDHTVARQLLRQGLINASELENNPFKHVLERSVGAKDHPSLDVRFEGVLPGDTYLLSTDGLHGVVDDNELAAILKVHANAELAAKALVALANEKGGFDNITAVVVRVLPPAPAEAAAR
jgi:serine/threonine protein phosphatase PrpC